jgi:hypothetical protein
VVKGHSVENMSALEPMNGGVMGVQLRGKQNDTCAPRPSLSESSFCLSPRSDRIIDVDNMSGSMVYKATVILY